jgi:Crinkler effector protein N-terminal domain
MAEGSYRIWCLIEGETAAFPVTASRDVPIGELKELIHEKGNKRALNGINAQDLGLWRVSMTMASDSTTNSPAGGSRPRPSK